MQSCLTVCGNGWQAVLAFMELLVQLCLTSVLLVVPTVLHCALHSKIEPDT
ncbi:MAG TPA: hypothetical protein V6D31_06460 [Candidatus Sericytochromatia bacterium]